MQKLLFLLIFFFGIMPSFSFAYSSSYNSSSLDSINRETEQIKACLRSDNAHWDFGYSMCTCNDRYSRLYDLLEDIYTISLTCVPKSDQKYIKIEGVNKEKAFVSFSTNLPTGVYVANITSFTGTLRRGCKDAFIKLDETYSFVQYLGRGYITDPIGGYCELSDIDEVSKYVPIIRSKIRREVLITTKGLRNIDMKKQKLQALLEKYTKEIDVIGKATQLWQSAFKKSLIEKEIEKLI